MLVATRWIFSSLLVLQTAGCALRTAREDHKVTGPVKRVYTANFDDTWRAAQKALTSYPLKKNNIDSGIIETDVIRGNELWPAPHKAGTEQPGLRYTLVLTAVTGDRGGKPATQVSILKKISLESSFFSDKRSLKSDGLEEQKLLYRIDREITIERALDRAYKANKI